MVESVLIWSLLESDLTPDSSTYRVIVNEWYKLKHLTWNCIWYFQVSACIPAKWVLGHLISAQNFVTQSNCSLMVRDFWEVQFSTSGPPTLLMSEAKLIVLKYEEVKSAQDVRGAIPRQLYYSLTYSLHVSHHNDFLTDSKTLVP